MTSNDWVEAEVEEHARSTPGGLTAAKKGILRKSLEKEFDEEEECNRDYVWGMDEGD